MWCVKWLLPWNKSELSIKDNSEEAKIITSNDLSNCTFCYMNWSENESWFLSNQIKLNLRFVTLRLRFCILFDLLFWAWIISNYTKQKQWKILYRRKNFTFNPGLPFDGNELRRRLNNYLQQSNLAWARAKKTSTWWAVNLKKHMTSMSSKLEPAIWSRNTGQKIRCLFCCCCNTKNTTNKTRQTLPTIPLTIRYLYYLLYNTSLENNSYTTFYTYVLSKLQIRTGFHLASSILLLLYLAYVVLTRVKWP